MTVEEILLGNKPKPSKILCIECNEIKNITEFTPRNRYRGRQRCIKCKLVVTKKWRGKNPHKSKEYNGKYFPRRRQELLREYGNKCNCCGETNQDLLQLDHIYNDGAKERREDKSRHIHLRLKRLGFPKDRYQLLCANCNWLKARRGRCTCQDYKKETPDLSSIEDYACL